MSEAKSTSIGNQIGVGLSKWCKKKTNLEGENILSAPMKLFLMKVLKPFLVLVGPFLIFGIPAAIIGGAIGKLLYVIAAALMGYVGWESKQDAPVLGWGYLAFAVLSLLCALVG